MTSQPAHWRTDSAFTGWGPYDTPEQAMADFKARETPVPFGTNEQWRAERRENARRFVTSVVNNVGDLGEYDRKLIDWAADTWDQPTTQVILSWIMRSYMNGVETGEAEARAEADPEAIFDPESAPSQFPSPSAWDEEKARRLIRESDPF